MSSQEPLTMEQLYASGEAKIAETKLYGIIRSTSALLSLVASLVLIWMLNRTLKRFTSVYHRLLLGMAIGDIIFSISQAHFNAAAPKDLNYAVWNAIGNRYTCSARGFFASVGVIASTFYIASLNLYSLATVKYQKDDRYIKKYIEPFLHAVPWGWALIYSVVTLILEGFNDAGGGNCIATQYKAPHCKGYEKGEVREGFTIPCLRGTHGGFPRLALYISFLVVPIVSGVALAMIYYAVKKMERAMRRYSTMNQQSNSRKVMGKAFSFTIAYLVTFVPWLVGLGYGWAGQGRASWPEILKYLTAILTPLQGLFNLIVYMQPKISYVKSRDDVSWLKATWVAFSAALQGGRGAAETSRIDSTAGGASSKWSSVKSLVSVTSVLARRNSSTFEKTASQIEVPAAADSNLKQEFTMTHEPSARVIAFCLDDKTETADKPSDETPVEQRQDETSEHSWNPADEEGATETPTGNN